MLLLLLGRTRFRRWPALLRLRVILLRLLLRCRVILRLRRRA